MREKMLKIADEIAERARLYRDIYGNDLTAFVRSPAYPIHKTLDEVAKAIHKVLNSPVDTDKPPETEQGTSKK